MTDSVSNTASLVHADVEMIGEDLAHLLGDIGPDIEKLGSLEERVRIWFDLTKVLDAVKSLVGSFDEHCASVIQKNPIEVKGIGILAGQRQGKDVWEKEELPIEVARKIADEVGREFGGELVAQQAAMRAVGRVFEVARQEWRKGDPTKQTPGLKSLGIDPSDYLTHEDGRWKLNLTGPR